jgi:hypothetical protein
MAKLAGQFLAGLGWPVNPGQVANQEISAALVGAVFLMANEHYVGIDVFAHHIPGAIA